MLLVSLVFINGIRCNRRYWVVLDQQQGVIYFVELEDICLVAKKQGIGASEEMRDVFEGGGGCF